MKNISVSHHALCKIIELSKILKIKLEHLFRAEKEKRTNKN